MTPPPMVVVTCICLTCVNPPAVKVEATVEVTAEVSVAVPTICCCCCCCWGRFVISGAVVTTAIAICAVTVDVDVVGAVWPSIPPLSPMKRPQPPRMDFSPPFKPGIFPQP